MNKTKIEWADYTWNPVTGCLHGCDYCYARRIAERFASESFKKNRHIFTDDCTHIFEIPRYSSKGKKESFPAGFQPTFHKYRLDEPKKIKKPSRIFVCSMADLFGDWVPDKWIEEVYMACQKACQHTFIFLTKNPKRYKTMYRTPLDFRNYMWLGTTVESQETANRRIPDLLNAGGNKFVSIEPLLGPVNLNRIEPPGRDDVIIHSLDGTAAVPFTVIENRPKLKWIIVGAQTGPGAANPKPEWIQSIIDQARKANIPIFLKDNLNWPEKIQEFPD